MVFDAFHIKKEPILIALTADPNPDVKNGKFTAILDHLNSFSISEILRYAKIVEKERAWNNYIISNSVRKIAKRLSPIIEE